MQRGSESPSQNPFAFLLTQEGNIPSVKETRWQPRTVNANAGLVENPRDQVLGV
jgi:hypothetical protein